MKETLLCPLEISVWECFLERSPNGSYGHRHRHQQKGGGARGCSQRTVALSSRSLGFTGGGALWSGKGGGNRRVEKDSPGYKFRVEISKPWCVQQSPD